LRLKAYSKNYHSLHDRNISEGIQLENFIKVDKVAVPNPEKLFSNLSNAPNQQMRHDDFGHGLALSGHTSHLLITGGIDSAR
jgi:hypothetical protein